MTGPLHPQIPISFPVREALAAEDFMPLPCNREAVTWIQDRFPDWPSPAIIIYGEKGCGKSHLLSLWHGKGEAFDDADQMIGTQEGETALFHALNTMRENGTYGVLTLARPAAQYDFILPDLASRMKALPHIQITAPDDQSVQAILVKLFHDRQLKVAPGVIAYILPRVERSFTAIRDLVNRLDHQALAAKRSVTIPLVREVL